MLPGTRRACTIKQNISSVTLTKALPTSHNAKCTNQSSSHALQYYAVLYLDQVKSRDSSLKSPLKHLSSANLNGQNLRHQKEDKTTSRNQTRGRFSCIHNTSTQAFDNKGCQSKASTRERQVIQDFQHFRCVRCMVMCNCYKKEAY